MAVEFDLSRYRKNLPAGGEAFLQELSNGLSEDSVQSVILFGSVVFGETTENSDIDLLIVLGDDASDSYVGEVCELCSKLAERHLEVSSYEADVLGPVVDRQTGMFRSGFATKEKNVEAGDFPSIFNTNRVALLLAPWRTVLAGVFEKAVTIYGPDVEPAWHQLVHPTRRPIRELVRSWLMTLVLSTSQLFYVLVSKRATLYSLESYKWATYTCAYHVTGSSARSLSDAIEVVPSVYRFDRWFLALREDPELSPAFLLVTPFAVSLVHLFSILAALRS